MAVETLGMMAAVAALQMMSDDIREVRAGD